MVGNLNGHVDSQLVGNSNGRLVEQLYSRLADNVNSRCNRAERSEAHASGRLRNHDIEVLQVGREARFCSLGHV